MKKVKNHLAVLLVLALVLCLMPATAFALDENETEIISVPCVTKVTPTTISVKAMDNVQYRLGSTGTWTSEAVFSGLYPSTTYAVYYRYGTGEAVSLGNYNTPASQSRANNTLIDSDAPYTLPYTEYVASYSLNNDLTYNLYLNAGKYDGYTNLRLCIEHNCYANNSNTATLVKHIVPAAANTVQVSGKTRFAFALKGLSAKQLGDELFITLYADKVSDGKTYITPLYATNLSQVAYNILASGDSDAKKRVAANLINYCGCAQTYFGYNTNHNVKDGLSAYSQYYSAGAPDPAMASLHVVVNDYPNAPVEISKYELSLDSKISWRIRFTVGSGITASNLRLKLTYTSVLGNTVNLTVSPVVTDDGVYFPVNEIGACDFQTAVDFTVYNGTDAVSPTYRSSIEHRCRHYANLGDANLTNLVYAMVNYSRAAKTLFAVTQ